MTPLFLLCIVVFICFFNYFVALSSIKGDVIIPDQGGWHGFKQIAKFLGKNIISIKTDLGLIDPEELDNIEIKDD